MRSPEFRPRSVSAPRKAGCRFSFDILQTGTAGHPRLTDAVQKFLLYLAVAGRAPSTRESYARSLDRLIAALGDMAVQRISSEQLVKAVADLQSFQMKSGKRSPVTMNGIKSAIRSFFNWADETGRCPTNPALLLRISRSISTHTEPIRAQEIEDFLRAIRTSRDKNRLRDESLFATYAYTGVRRIEALRLTVADVDIPDGSLHIAQPKGGPSRYQPIPRRLLQILDPYLASHRLGKKLGLAPLFPGRAADTHLSAKQTWIRFEKWKKLSGIREKLTIHSFRAGFATILYKSNADVLLVARAMGHNDPAVTCRYIADNMMQIRRAAETAFPIAAFNRT
jgi:site-specific recombinase XerD